MDSSTYSVAAGRLAPTRLRQGAAILVGTLILAASAQVSVPMWPVPLTLELYAVFMIGALFGPRLGALTVAAWLLEGAFGLPVFAHASGGVARFMGPTAGYLWSFPLVAMIAGMVATIPGRGMVRTLGVFGTLWAAGMICLLAGWAWLSVLMGAKAAWASGVVPFLVGDVVKAALATATLAAWQSLRQRRPTDA